MEAPDKKSYNSEVTRPVWLPFNDTSKELVASLVECLGYPTTGPKADKYVVVVSSLLKATQVLLKKASDILRHTEESLCLVTVPPCR